MRLVKILLSCLSVLVVSACVSTSDDSSNKSCSANEVKTWAYQNLKDYYLFYDQVPSVNPTSYSSAESLVEDLRVLPYDRFSRIAVTTEEQEVFDEGKTFGIGVLWEQDNEGNYRVAATYDDSPIGRAGIERGDILTAIGGIAANEITSSSYQQLVGTRDRPVTSVWTFSDAVTGQELSAPITPALFNINTVLHSETISLPNFSEKIGYLVFDSFLGTSEAELDTAISNFRNDNIKELILDLRYNGGGFVTIATKLASQIAGPSIDGQMLMEYRHNNKYSEFDFTIDFETVDERLDLDRLIVLTTDYTASASELVISALSPYIEVVTIGTTTVGKPYISFGNDFCNKSMHALQAEGFNADDVSVYGGIAPSCASSDDLTKGFGYSASEGMLSDALDYLVYGRCDTPSLAVTTNLLNDDVVQAPIANVLTKPGTIGGSRGDRSNYIQESP